MKKYGVCCGSELARVLVCSLVVVFFLFSAAGCEKENVTPIDDEDEFEETEEDFIYATVYVDGTVGDDAYDGSSLKVMGDGVGPKKTIQAGIDITPKIRRCYVAPGVYYEQFNMADGVILLGAGDGTTIIDINDNRGNGITIMDCHTYPTTVAGFTIRGGSCYGDNAGIRIQNSTNIVIRNNLITGNVADGIRTYNASARIVNNTITRNGRNGIMAWGSDLEVINNIIVDNCLEWLGYTVAGWGLRADRGVIHSTYNDVWLHNIDYGTGTTGTCAPGIGDISTDPLFVDVENGDFRLRGDSPCIDAGIYVKLDYFGEAPDLGAFEYKE
ncbi:MAG TPA: right-handed parallel beta-helix repeat-containing protein [Candidatus Krumholzibacterium sp.]|nr:right-handed parallel beta-helix repeat-containing protein [Candidatus Krumholzibacterium sp.]